jgi:hypothetical protein
MSPASGWYPDPTGQADLRYWDGQGWTGQTSAKPVAHTPTLVASSPAVPLQERAPQAEQPFRSARALPGSLASSEPAVGTPYRLPSKNFYGLIAGLVVLATAAGIAIPLTMSSHHKHASTNAAVTPLTTLSPAPKSSATPKAVTPAPSTPATSSLRYTLPAQFAGYLRITDSRAAAAEAEFNKAWTVRGEHVVGIYGGATGDPEVIGAFEAISLTPAGEREAVLGATEGMDLDHNLTWEPADPGVYGGTMECGSDYSAHPFSMCAFADDTTFGFVIVNGEAGSGLQDAMDMRSQVEPAPTSGPAPAAPSGTGRTA